MPAIILDGKILAEKIQKKIVKQIQGMLSKNLRAPCLAVIIAGEDPASMTYVCKKRQVCQILGINSKNYDLPSQTSETGLVNLIEQLNVDPNIDGILMQLPLPKHIATEKILETINPAKDVDGFHPYNIGCLAIGAPKFRPCTPKGIMVLLEHYKIQLKGLNAVVVGASNLVGKPMALELLNVGSTVDICHIHTRDLALHVKNADLVISAAGVPNLIKGDWIKNGTIVIDVGFNRLNGGRIRGDVEFEIAKTRAAWITPVPGGVGPMTVAMLMENTLFAYLSQESANKMKEYWKD